MAVPPGLREDRACVAAFQCKRPLSLGLWHQLSHFTGRRKQGPPFRCNMSQHRAAGPFPSFHYFQAQKWTSTTWESEKDGTEQQKDKGEVGEFAPFNASSSGMKTILHKYYNSQTTSKHCDWDSIMPQLRKKCSVCSFLYVFFLVFLPYGRQQSGACHRTKAE